MMVPHGKQHGNQLIFKTKLYTMKQLIFVFVLLLIPVFAIGQKLDVKKTGDTTELTFQGTYLVQRDTSASGVVTIQLIPTEELQKELESTLGTLQAEVSNLDIRINELQERKRAANREIKEVERLIKKLSQNRSIEQPKVESQLKTKTKKKN